MKNVTSSELQEIVKNANSKADICRALELQPKGGNYAIIDRLLKENNIVWNKEYTPWNKGKSYKYKRYSLSEILIENSPMKSTFKLKLRLFKENLKEPKCEVCGYTDSVELHHINGNPLDNRIENLQILCPNCHSKTENFRIKNSSVGRKIQDPKTLFLNEEEIQQRDLKNKARKCGKTLEQYLEDKLKGRRILEDKICPICNKIFRPKGGTQKYCSQECYKEDMKGNRPVFLQLIQDFKELKSFVQVGLKYNVSDNAVRKWCKLYGIPFKSKELKEFLLNFN
jgi:5-methylcytosine-specific restriction endonuclease McrA